jgi:hypothetical protein
MTDLGELQRFLGIEIEGNREQRSLQITQNAYIHRILHRHRMHESTPVATPVDPHVHLTKSHQDYTATIEDQQQYQSAIGSLMYAMLGTRPDIAFAVGLVSQFSTNPGQAHWTAVKRVFRYLRHTNGFGICYGLSFTTEGYSDADWGAGEDRKSTGGYIFNINGGAVSWTSKKQPVIALSSTEAEYMALTQATKEGIWLTKLLWDIGGHKHINEIKTINADNQGSIALAKNPTFHARTKHIDIQYHFIRHHIEAENIFLQYCPTEDMTADPLTKGLARPAHERHIQAMGLGYHFAKLSESQATDLGPPNI